MSVCNFSWSAEEGRGRLLFSDCNLKCNFCLHGEDREGSFLPGSPEEITNRFEKLDELYIGGGEPLLCEDLSPFLRQVRKRVKIVRLKTNGTVPSLLKKLLYDWLVDSVELWINGPITRCGEFCGVEINVDLLIASITSLMNWAGEQKIVFVVREDYGEEDFNIMADILEGSRDLVLLIKDGVEISEEMVNRFRAVAGHVEVRNFKL